jgi:hypothetical protein
MHQTQLPMDAEHTISVTLPARTPDRTECGWCANAMTVTVIFDCGHAAAMCDGCFGPPDPFGSDDPLGLDIMDWGSQHMGCPDCAG